MTYQLKWHKLQWLRTTVLRHFSESPVDPSYNWLMTVTQLAGYCLQWHSPKFLIVSVYLLCPVRTCRVPEIFRIFSSNSEVKSEMSEEAAEAAEEVLLMSIADKSESLLSTSFSLSQNSFMYLTFSLPSCIPDGEFFSCLIIDRRCFYREEEDSGRIRKRKF